MGQRGDEDHPSRCFVRRPVEAQLEKLDIIGNLRPHRGCGQFEAQSMRSGAFFTNALASLPTSSYFGPPLFEVS